ncbi:ArsR/SmtB family transcription factor [Tuwongella immobilis]|uniref:HTH arsR-type domain-containing protein n=1 Tax=Tuwongella immobilis TaxID=692036 RepID=A0A6C2YPU3_9BACT|nr:metalloregulator ArsR/SmtB family transcription factor [Tuwongella immobilis]VIP03331.1 family transcriptional regulator : ArsR family transcriptional regulator OS=Afipia sp. P52-10 GN=X566_18745 PE=4 SV=1: HTH_20 [Tuwongella immobilis]VTS04034.1 family transcriptional regulator : ArsR family transcriptional regulator OS=Afipia sp. P52-10 GN=X566_18745 PE=4 SV=1: HTH_20 [Tuwongella immobilis]
MADAIFRALSDSTRRKVLERLAKGPASVSELAAQFQMKLPSFVQHLSILEKCQLVTSQKIGRTRYYRIERDQLKIAEDWLVQQRREWETRLDQLDAYLVQLHAKESRESDT